MLNINTCLDEYPRPQIYDLLNYLVIATIFTKIDLVNTYYQVCIIAGH